MFDLISACINLVWTCGVTYYVLSLQRRVTTMEGRFVSGIKLGEQIS